MRTNLTVGSDVEFFLSHRRVGVIPATSMNTPGTKLYPVPLGNGTFHRDNISVEIQPPPATTPDEFRNNGAELRNALAAVYMDMDIEILTACAQEFTEEMVECVEAQEIGCEPDLCAYSRRVMPATNAESMSTIRTGSGHIHLGGVDDLSEALRAEVVKHLDMIEGPRLMLDDNDMDHLAFFRRRYYGQAGRYRIKPYGLEWRTPSAMNWYMYTYRGKAEQLFGALHAAVAMVDAGILVNDLIPTELVDTVRDAIDTSQVKNMLNSWEPLHDIYKANDEARAIIEEVGGIYDYPALFAS